MTTYTLAWGWLDEDPSGQHTRRVHTEEELDAVLDQLADGTPRLVDIYEGTWVEGEPTPRYGFQLVWGHPQRAALTWLGDHPAVATDESLPAWPEPIPHDQGEAEPHRTRLTPAQVREALRAYVQTGNRPAGITWLPA